MPDNPGVPGGNTYNAVTVNHTSPWLLRHITAGRSNTKILDGVEAVERSQVMGLSSELIEYVFLCIKYINLMYVWFKACPGEYQ